MDKENVKLTEEVNTSIEPLTPPLKVDNIYNMDCLDGMRLIPDGSIDCIICDLPYGTTACKWDIIIPFDKLWAEYMRVCKPNGAIVLFCKQPFTTQVISSNLELYRYNLIWVKDNHDNPMMAKKRFLNVTEDICVFYQKQCVYNPQGIRKCNKVTRQGRGESLSQNNERKDTYVQEYENYPNNILYFGRDADSFHPTQKPVELIRYLVETYTNEGDVVLDNCMGSGTTAVACIRTKRHYIGFELDKGFYDKATERIKAESRQLRLFW